MRVGFEHHPRPVQPGGGSVGHDRVRWHHQPEACQTELEGVDQLGYLAKKEPEITAYERTRAGAS